MASEHPWWGPARVPFLLLTPACMALGRGVECLAVGAAGFEPECAGCAVVCAGCAGGACGGERTQ